MFSTCIHQNTRTMKLNLKIIGNPRNKIHHQNAYSQKTSVSQWCSSHCSSMHEKTTKRETQIKSFYLISTAPLWYTKTSPYFSASFLRMEVQEHGLASLTSRIGLTPPYNYIILLQTSEVRRLTGNTAVVNGKKKAPEL